MRHLVARLVIPVVVLMGTHAFAGAREEVTAAQEQAIKVFNGRSADAIAALYAVDGVFISARYPFRIEGRDAIRAFWNNTLQAFQTVRLVLRQPETRLYGDNVAVEAGYFTFVGIDNAGKALVVNGRYAATWAKISGNWLIVSDHASMLPQ